VDKVKELIHYVAVYSAILFAWPFFMAWGIGVAVIGTGVSFIVADQLAHRFIIGEKTQYIWD